jgi:peptide-methionine (S)-S-oxide reductase
MPAPTVVSYARAALLVGTLLLAGCGTSTSQQALEADAPTIPAPVLDEPPGQGQPEVAVLAGGCFWGVQGVFQHVTGVTQAVSGYAGGTQATAEYESVSTGATGHAESVQITFDPQQISYGHLLQIYFSVAHDPTELNRQGPDVGSQYRSAIFPLTAEQADVAKAYIDQLKQAAVFRGPIVTRIEPDRTFFPAEAYHQDYLTLNPTQGYIARYDMPKIANLKTMFPQQFRAEPALVMAKATKPQ